ncbi:AsnC family transcriptional regulator [Streptomyces sp. NPDC058122]|uniref:AsnC family transcriptional regulator n=1 Tax=Streptomyces sp. NPDC058122 TaxID=3346349 RepID=UPI0036E5520D
MARVSADSVLSLVDQRLVAALQWDGRITAERAAHVLGLSSATVRRRLHMLGADGTVRVVISPVARPRNGGSAGALFLRIRVLREGSRVGPTVPGVPVSALICSDGLPAAFEGGQVRFDHLRGDGRLAHGDSVGGAFAGDVLRRGRRGVFAECGPRTVDAEARQVPAQRAGTDVWPPRPIMPCFSPGKVESSRSLGSCPYCV